ncbi:PilC/PilY family type IV pilus protein [Parachitinimonas caeni]|uniref:PilC/PilY family type IV pilus protein n=1 Tax=Parachitinimonas caeni TaxID=3031301 RepID=A0ABT7DT74_9NEIS|nr:PilC/PilY family type IV pilus protein [Parachitinimonas caeni]MDK2122994.1 PilC/PilY family type IV pilus protein [Parachitinimonas caeni]
MCSFALMSQPIIAADISNVPLGTLAANTSVKPNLMFILDDSGSMGQSYTPDWVNDVYCRQAYVNPNNNWVDTSSGNNWTDPALGITLRKPTGSCLFGSPPYASPYFNSQWYNPAIVYAPPKDAAGNDYPTQNSANTTAWTQVKVDGFGKQAFYSSYDNGSYDFYNYGATTKINLTTQFPIPIFCDTRGGTGGTGTCKENISDNNNATDDYAYPDTTSVTSATIYKFLNYKGTAPYYYNITSDRYCTDDSFNSCTSSSTPTGSYTVPARYVWCKDTGLTQCRARRSDNAYNKVSFFGATIPAVTGAKGTGTLTISSAGDTTYPTKTTVTSIVINGVDILGAPVSVTAINNSTKRTNLASAIAAQINSFVSSKDYTATSSSNVVTIKGAVNGVVYNGSISVSAADVTDTTGASFGFTTSPASGGFSVLGGTSSAKGSTTFDVTKAGDASYPSITQVSSIKVNGVEILGGPVSVSGINSSTKQSSLETAIANKITSYTSSPDYTGSISSSKVKITAVANGSDKNGTVTITATDTFDSSVPISHTVTIGTTSVSGGVDDVPSASVPASRFNRVDIVSSNNSYPKAITRTDCAGATCTYAEEMTNFANWFSYYRSRLQTMKSAAGQAFSTITNAYRVGFITINVNSSAEFLGLDTFEGTQRTNWYTKFYDQTPGSSTPLREALSRVGRYFAGKTSGINAVTSGSTAIQYACQKNYALLTTDGYWNGNTSQDLSGSEIVNTDNNSAATATVTDAASGATSTIKTSSRDDGVYDGALSGSTKTLADVAQYYYLTDLIADTDPRGKNVVPLSADDPVNWQHMVTYSLGLGVDGRLKYQSDYKTSASGDFAKIRTGGTGCEWQATSSETCDWPVPAANADTAVDDLWHAAVNGRGKYFSAKSADQVVAGLKEIVASIQVVTGAASSAATSSPVITQTDNYVYVTTYRTGKWDGQISAYTINPDTAAVSATPKWAAQELLNTKGAASRKIYTQNGTGGRIDFSWSGLDGSAKSYFQSKCSAMSQCATLTGADQTKVNNGQELVDFLRGDKTNEALFRTRDYILGDLVNSSPVFVDTPNRNYTDSGYLGSGGYKEGNASRKGVLYAAGNDGMLHAFDGSTGDELWAYVPRMLLSGMYVLGDAEYSTLHRYFVDGQLTAEDVYDTNDNKWKTILVVGLGAGGKGYFALDVTDPDEPKPLWEFCNSSSLCAKSDSDMGYAFGNPVITKRPTDGKWVTYVTSGYAQGTTQAGRLYMLDAIKGDVLNETASGTDGLGKIAGYVEFYDQNNTAKKIYGGDLTGKVYAFDVTTATPTVAQIATLSSSGIAQPVTTTPIVTTCLGKRLVLVGTGQYLGVGDVSNTQTQSFYGFRDDIPAARQTLNGSSSMIKQTIDFTNLTVSNNSVDINTHDGWYVDFQSGTGERVNVDPILGSGITFVPTNIPTTTPQACEYGGKSRGYVMDYCSGKGLQQGFEAPQLVVGATKVYFSTTSKTSLGVLLTYATGPLKAIDLGTGLATPATGGKRSSWRELVPN